MKPIWMIGTYFPEHCGIATFSQSLAEAIGDKETIKIAPIDDENRINTYTLPAINDLRIIKQKPETWRRAANKIAAMKKEPIVIFQHEFGLDPGENDKDGIGHGYEEMSAIFNTSKISNIAYLHTVKRNPTKNERKILQQLAKTTDALVVTTNSAIDILRDKPYGIEKTVIEHIDHGTRNFTDRDRDEVKEEYNLLGKLVYITLGMKGERKGLEDSIEAFGKFINTKLSEEQRKKIVYIIGGGYHPNAVKQKIPEKYNQKLDKVLKQNKLKYAKTKNPHELGKLANTNNVIFLEPEKIGTALDEKTWKNLYIMTNGLIALYPNKDQISSGILADTIGSGRVPITTQFEYAKELIHPDKTSQKGILGINEPRPRGLCVEIGKKTVEQAVECLEYLTFNEEQRMIIEKVAALKGSETQWTAIGDRLLRFLDYNERMKNQNIGKDPIFRN